MPLNFPAKQPKGIFIEFVLDTASAGTIAENSFRFQNSGMVGLRVALSCERIPTGGIITDYATNDY
jgi:hypothetical protein